MYLPFPLTLPPPIVYYTRYHSIRLPGIMLGSTIWLYMHQYAYQVYCLLSKAWLVTEFVPVPVWWCSHNSPLPWKSSAWSRNRLQNASRWKIYEVWIYVTDPGVLKKRPQISAWDRFRILRIVVWLLWQRKLKGKLLEILVKQILLGTCWYLVQ